MYVFETINIYNIKNNFPSLFIFLVSAKKFSGKKTSFIILCVEFLINDDEIVLVFAGGNGSVGVITNY